MGFLANLKDYAGRQWLEYLTKSDRVLKRLNHLERNLPWQENEVEQTRVAAIQAELVFVNRVEPYVDLMYLACKEAKEKGAKLVVFPEDNGTHLLGLLPGFNRLIKSLDGGKISVGKEEILIADVFRYAGPYTERVYLTLFSELAKRFRMYIHGGSVILPRADGKVYNTAFLFGPDGKVLLRQDKLHLMPMEVEWGLTPGSVVEVVDTELGRIGMPVCMDATYFETFRILSNMGAEIILLPTANPEEYNQFKALRGIWPRVQETPVYGIKSSMVGSLAGFKLTGKAGIFAPRELTEKRDGILAEFANPEGVGLVFADLDMPGLRAYRERTRTEQVDAQRIYSRYLPRLYKVGAENAEDTDSTRRDH